MAEMQELRFYSVREFRDHASQVLRSPAPVLVTRHGKPAGVYIPLESTEQNPISPALRDHLLDLIGDYIQRRLKKAGITEEEILDDFEASRQPRR